MKDIIRKELLNIRINQDEETKKRKEVVIVERIELLREFKKSDVVALYYPIKGEVNLLPLFYRYKRNKIFVFPRIEGENMIFSQVRELDEMKIGKFGIMEPVNEIFPLKEIDLFIVPGIAFDPDGYRIGYGKGYYDKLISQKLAHQCTVGVCFDFQMVDSIERDEWDVRVDYVITNNIIISTNTTQKLKRRQK